MFQLCPLTRSGSSDTSFSGHSHIQTLVQRHHLLKKSKGVFSLLLWLWWWWCVCLLPELEQGKYKRSLEHSGQKARLCSDCHGDVVGHRAIRRGCTSHIWSNCNINESKDNNGLNPVNKTGFNKSTRIRESSSLQ